MWRGGWSVLLFCVGSLEWRRYADGIKQSREPMLAFVREAALFVSAYERPALAPLDALPPNRTPRIATPEVGTLV